MSSPIDDFFEEIFGYRPTKNGKAFELLVAAALKLSGLADNVVADAHVKGQYSGTTYQIDADGDGKLAVEAKDYTHRNEPVGRGDLQKLAGGLLELDYDKGVLASATGFTGPSKEYASATGANPMAKPIELLHVRPSVEEDETGRIKTIMLEANLYVAEFDKGLWEPVLAEDAKAILAKRLGAKPGQEVRFQQRIEAFYRADDTVLATVEDLTRNQVKVDFVTGVAEGTWEFSERAHVKVNGDLLPIERLKYRVPFQKVTSQIVIEAQGTSRLLVKQEGGQLDKLFTDADLKRVHFAEDGSVTLDPPLNKPTSRRKT